jgi:hypothetical protein
VSPQLRSAAFYPLIFFLDVFSDADRDKFEDPAFYKQLRHALEMEMTVRTQQKIVIAKR